MEGKTNFGVFLMGVLAIIAGSVCMVTSITFFILEFKKAESVKEKWQVFFGFFLESLDGLSSLFYLGLLLLLAGLLIISNIL